MIVNTDKIKQLMDIKCTTGYRLSKQIGINQVVFSRYLHNKRNVPYEVCCKIAKALDAPVDDITELNKYQSTITILNDDEIKRNLEKLEIDIDVEKGKKTKRMGLRIEPGLFRDFSRICYALNTTPSEQIRKFIIMSINEFRAKNQIK